MVEGKKDAGTISSKRKCDLNDYELTTTLGTGKLTKYLLPARLFRSCHACQEQEDRRIFRHEETD